MVKLRGEKRFLRIVVSATGLPALRWRLLPPGLYCLNYHRIGDSALCPFDRNSFSCTAEQFDLHLRVLRSRFELINLERLSYYIAHPHRVRAPLALLTFDDGYRDNFTLAFPILQRYSVPAAFFLPTGFIAGQHLPWWDQIAWLLRHCRRPQIRFPGTEEALPLSPASLEASIRRALRLAKTNRKFSFSELLDRLREACGLDPPPPDELRTLFMNWDEVRSLRKAGMDIGSHSHSHEILSHLSIERQRQELGRSREILQAHLGEPVRALAYPVGGLSSYTPETKAVARSVGYELAFNFVPAVNRFPIQDPYAITRLSGDDAPTAASLRLRIAFPGLAA